MSESVQPQGMQPDPQFVIAALQDELHAAQDNRLYLLALLKQAQAEFLGAQEMWELERESLTKSLNEARGTADEES